MEVGAVSDTWHLANEGDGVVTEDRTYTTVDVLRFTSFSKYYRNYYLLFALRGFVEQTFADCIFPSELVWRLCSDVVSLRSYSRQTLLELQANNTGMPDFLHEANGCKACPICDYEFSYVNFVKMREERCINPLPTGKFSCNVSQSILTSPCEMAPHRQREKNLLAQFSLDLADWFRRSEGAKADLRQIRDVSFLLLAQNGLDISGQNEFFDSFAKTVHRRALLNSNSVAGSGYGSACFTCFETGSEAKRKFKLAILGECKSTFQAFLVPSGDTSKNYDWATRNMIFLAELYCYNMVRSAIMSLCLRAMLNESSERVFVNPDAPNLVLAATICAIIAQHARRSRIDKRPDFICLSPITIALRQFVQEGCSYDEGTVVEVNKLLDHASSQICKVYLKGQCRYGSECRFLHAHFK